MNFIQNIYIYIILFALYSFMGWIIEIIFRSFKQNRFVNAGFLFGPFIPIYGIGAVSIIFFYNHIQNENFILQILIYGIVLTIIEYCIGLFSERVFGLSLWDYSENKFNLQGKICLSFSIVWAVLSFTFVTFLHPIITDVIVNFDKYTIILLSVIFAFYFIIDFIFSIISISLFKDKVAYLYSEYKSLNNAEIEKIFHSLERLLKAFPDLNKYLFENIYNSLKKHVDKLLTGINAMVYDIINERKSAEKEYNYIIQDILENEEFLQLKNYRHHNSSIYKHAEEVSYISYRISKFLNLDYTSTARGGLLHDFFLYDWRDHDEPDLAKKKYHGLEHPKIALENSERNFKVNDIEKDIIIKHMWPLTLVPPKYKESFVVTFVDKYVASKEYVGDISMRNKLI